MFFFLENAKCIRSLGRNSHVSGCFFHRKVNAPRYMNRIRKARKPGGVKKAISSRVGPQTHAFTWPWKKHPAISGIKYCYLLPKAWNLHGCFFYLPVNASICLSNTKPHCVTNLRASTQRCALRVLELLRRVYNTYIDTYTYTYMYTHMYLDVYV